MSQRSPRRLAEFKGPTSEGGEGGEKGRGEGRRKGERKEGEGEGKGMVTLPSLAWRSGCASARHQFCRLV